MDRKRRTPGERRTCRLVLASPAMTVTCLGHPKGSPHWQFPGPGARSSTQDTAEENLTVS
ncbi:protein of unknown function [Cyanobium sp. NIES-981]|nr:protein of unknown function [Cyanobium sp. NIES-981]